MTYHVQVTSNTDTLPKVHKHLTGKYTHTLNADD